MKSRRWQGDLPGSVLIAAIFAIAQPALAEAPKPVEPSQETVRQLIEGLGAPTRATRAAAEKELLELGPGILPHLPPPELLSGVSVRASVERIRHELERRQARDSMRPSVVSLNGTKSLGEWISEISRQSRNPLDSTQLATSIQERRVSLMVENAHFWPTLDGLLQQSGLTSEPEPQRRGLRIVRRDEGAARETIGYAGPFRLAAPEVQIVSTKIARVMLFAQPEPRLRPLFLQFASADISAKSAERLLAPFNPDASYELIVNEPGGRSRMQLDFVIPPGVTLKNLKLEGTFRMTTAADSAAIRFIDLSKQPDGRELAIDRRRGGVTVSLRRVRHEQTAESGRELRISVTVAYDTGGPAFESHRTWILHNEVYLEDSAGKRVPLNGGSETTLQADGAVGMEYRFVDLPDPLPDYTFVYTAPILIVDVPVRFALESLSVRQPD